MSGIDILMATDRAAGKILAPLAGIKKMDVAGGREAEEKISENAKKNTAREMNEYLVRGAVLVCSKGSCPFPFPSFSSILLSDQPEIL